MFKNSDKQYKQGPGRPKWSGERTAKCDVRLNSEEDFMLQELSERNDVTRSTIMRKALRDFYKFNTHDTTNVDNMNKER